MISDSWKIAKKELRDYFSSSAALLFLGIFLIAVYIVFFWVEAFFARNLADIRPFFQWIPVLFIFLISALTMHSWSEERHRGTIEIMLTSALSPWVYILGKFVAVLILIIVALILTLPLPIVVSMLGEMDWGPVLGGYVAALFLAAAYIAIGLWASAQTENQIVSLIITIVVASILYIIGSTTITSLFSYEVGEWLRAIASGARFESITRGVLDLRDVIYYLTLVIGFLLLTRRKLESLRWQENVRNDAPRKWNKLIVKAALVLMVINLLVSLIVSARLDLTQGKIYSLSSATKTFIHELDEPLLIRGYFSSSTHPLLAPLIPRVRDLLSEYVVQGNRNVRIEFIDPLEQAKFEEEAGMKFGIRPVAFHAEDKYKATVINTYFNVLVAYEDQFEVLDYKDLVDLKASAGRYEVDLKNPEYQITRAIKSVVSKAQREVTSFQGLQDLLVLSGYVSVNENLPSEKQNILTYIQQATQELRQQANDNFDYLVIDPDSDQLTEQYLREKLNAKPFAGDELVNQPYWFYFTLTDGNKTVPVTFTNHNIDDVKASIKAAYKRLLPDLKRTVGIMRPLARPGPAGISESPGIPKHFSILRNVLRQSVNIIDVDLRDGVVPQDIDFLMVLAPRFLHPQQINAIKEFLGSGGSLLISSSSIDVNVSYFTEVYPVNSGLEDWLKQLGVTIKNTLVLDEQHGKYSLPVSRQVGDMRVRETSLENYPYIIDVRGEGLNQETTVTSGLGQVFIPWASPLSIDESTKQAYTVTPLLNSSDNSWLSDSHVIIPNYSNYPELGFDVPVEKPGSQLLAVMIEGVFDANKDKPGRLIVLGSSTLFTDGFADQMSQSLRNEYRRPMQLMQNLIDWSLEDRGLLDVLRKHSRFTRTLTTLDEQAKTHWEYLIYSTGLLGILLIGYIRVILAKRSRQRGLKLINR